MKKYSFKAEIQGHESGGAFVIIPFDVEKAFGKKRVKIVAKINGATYRGSLVRMGTPDHFLLIRKDIRQEIGKDVGDIVKISMQEDIKPRVVVVPDDLKTHLKKNPEAKNFFDQLSYTHQKEYVQWIEGAKRAATRENRIAKTIEMLLAGKKGK